MDDDFDIRDTYAAQDAVAESAWSHPGDAEYDNYDSFPTCDRETPQP